MHVIAVKMCSIFGEYKAYVNLWITDCHDHVCLVLFTCLLILSHCCGSDLISSSHLPPFPHYSLSNNNSSKFVLGLISLLSHEFSL